MSNSKLSNSNQSHGPSYMEIATRNKPTQTQQAHIPVAESHSTTTVINHGLETSNSKTGSNQQRKGHSSAKNYDTENEFARCYICQELHLKSVIKLCCPVIACKLIESQQEVVLLRRRPGRKDIGTPYRVVTANRYSYQEVKQKLDAIADIQGKVEEAKRLRREEVRFHTQGKDPLCMICDETHPRGLCLAVCFVDSEFGKLTFYTRTIPKQPQLLRASYCVVKNPKYPLKRMKYLIKKCTTPEQRVQLFQETTQKEREHFVMASQPVTPPISDSHPTSSLMAPSGNSNSSANVLDVMVSSTPNIELLSQDGSTSNYPVEVESTITGGSYHSNTDGENGISPIWTQAVSEFPALDESNLNIDLNGDNDDPIVGTQSDIETWLQILWEMTLSIQIQNNSR